MFSLFVCPGTTKRPWKFTLPVPCFNPRTPRGVRRLHSLTLFRSAIFQPTHPAGGRRQQAQPSHGPAYFNPRTPRGVRRPRCRRRRRTRYGFNPRTPRGVRPKGPRTMEVTQCFNPRTPRGVRPYQFRFVPANSKFQPTHPAGGATGTPYIEGWAGKRFNPRTPRGVRPPLLGNPLLGVLFQPTHPAGGGDHGRRAPRPQARKFQPTHPARGD